MPIRMAIGMKPRRIICAQKTGRPDRSGRKPENWLVKAVQPSRGTIATPAARIGVSVRRAGPEARRQRTRQVTATAIPTIALTTMVAFSTVSHSAWSQRMERGLCQADVVEVLPAVEHEHPGQAADKVRAGESPDEQAVDRPPQVSGRPTQDDGEDHGVVPAPPRERDRADRRRVPHAADVPQQAGQVQQRAGPPRARPAPHV